MTTICCLSLTEKKSWEKKTKTSISKDVFKILLFWQMIVNVHPSYLSCDACTFYMLMNCKFCYKFLNQCLCPRFPPFIHILSHLQQTTFEYFEYFVAKGEIAHISGSTFSKKSATDICYISERDIYNSFPHKTNLKQTTLKTSQQ